MNLNDVSSEYEFHDQYKIKNQTFAKTLAKDDDLKELAQKIFNCGSYLAFSLVPDNDGVIQHKLSSTNSCHQRCCPRCQSIKSNRWKLKLSKCIPKMLKDYPDSKFITLNLNIEDCHISKLRKTIDKLNKAWNKLCKRKDFPAIAFLKTIEVTRNPKNGLAHPHIHALLMVNYNYFDDDRFINEERWTTLWKECLRANYYPNIQSSSINLEDIENNAIRFAKYQVKGQDLLSLFSDREWLYEYIRQIRGVRLISLGGIFKEYIKQSYFKKELNNSDFEKVVYSWNTSKNKYLSNSSLSI